MLNGINFDFTFTKPARLQVQLGFYKLTFFQKLFKRLKTRSNFLTALSPKCFHDRIIYTSTKSFQFNDLD